MNKAADKEASRFDEVERLRTDYLRELTALSKVLIAISTGALGVLLSPFGVDVSTRTGIRGIVAVWILLSCAVVFGFIQVFTFSSRFKSRADYLRACDIVDTLVALRAPNEHLNTFLESSDRYKKSFDRKYKICSWLVLTQGTCLMTAFAVLAHSMYHLLSGSLRR